MRPDSRVQRIAKGVQGDHCRNTVITVPMQNTACKIIVNSESHILNLFACNPFFKIMLAKWKRVARERGEEEGGNRSGTNVVVLRCYLVANYKKIHTDHTASTC